MQKITAQILATNELKILAEQDKDGLYRGVIQYAKGPHKGQMIIRSKTVFPRIEESLAEMGEIVEQAKAVVMEKGTGGVRYEPLSEEEYQQEIQNQIEAEAKA